MGASRIAPPWLFSAILLLLVATANVNNFFGYHAPGAIADSLQSTYQLTTSQFGLLFTVYSAPNVILVFIGGLAIDRWGPALTSLTFSALMLLGLVIFALAPIPDASFHPSDPHQSNPAMPYFIVGRLLLGFGECLCASVATMLGHWYKSSALTFAVGFNQAYVQLFGSAAAFAVLPLMKLQSALWLTAGVGLIAFVANCGYVFIHYRYPEYRPEIDQIDEFSDYDDELLNDHLSDSDEDEELVLKPKVIGAYQNGHGHNGNGNGYHHDSPDMNYDYNRTINPSINQSNNQSTNGSIYHSTLGVFHELPWLFWYVTLMITLLSPVLYTYTAFGPLFFMEKWNLTASQAGSATSVLYVTILFSPFSGYIIDRYGYRTAIQAVATAFIPLGFALLTFTDISPYVGMTLLGLTYAVTENTGYSMVAFACPEHRLGVAYGIVGCCVSFSLLFEPATVGWIRESTGDFYYSNVLFIVLSLLGWLTSVWIWWYDSTGECVMSGPAFCEEQEEQEMDDEEALQHHGIDAISHVYADVVLETEPLFVGTATVRRKSFDFDHLRHHQHHIHNHADQTHGIY